MLEDRRMLDGVGETPVSGSLIYGSDSARHLFTLDSQSGAFNLIGTMPGVMDDIAFNQQGELYGICGSSSSDLYRINPGTGDGTFVGHVGVLLNALTFRDDGTLFGAKDSLYTINTHTGASTRIGTLTNGSVTYHSAGDLAFSPVGTLFLTTTDNSLVSVNPGTGATTLVGGIGFNEVFGLAFSQDGVLLAMTNSSEQLIRINTSTGAGTPITSFSGHGVTGAFGADRWRGSLPQLSIDDVSMMEGNSGAKTFSFTVSMTGANPFGASVEYATADGSATATDNDYVAKSDTLTWAVGDTTPKTISITVSGDTIIESDESFFVNLSVPANAAIADGQGVGTIVDDDGPLPQLSIDNVSMVEGNSGATTFSFTVSMTGSNPSGASVKYATADGTATTADNDYVAKSDTLTWPAGDTSAKTISITVKGDMVLEANESFYVNLSDPMKAGIAHSQGVGTISNDDGLPSLSINNLTVKEDLPPGASFTRFTVRLSAPSGQEVRVNYLTQDLSAEAYSDYMPRHGQLVFAPGQIEQIISVAIKRDAVYEDNERFCVRLTDAVHATIPVDIGTCTIKNDDPKPAVSISGVTKREGNAGTTMFDFVVALSAVSGRDTLVHYSTKNGTARAGSDYVAASNTLTIPAGTRKAKISVPVYGDKNREGNETFQAVLSSPIGAIIANGKGKATGTILNDDRPGVLLTPSRGVPGAWASTATDAVSAPDSGSRTAAVAAIMQQWTSAGAREDRCDDAVTGAL